MRLAPTIKKSFQLAPIIIFTSLVSCSSNSHSPSKAHPKVITHSVSDQKNIIALLRIMNHERRQRGKKQLVLDARLTRAAQKHADSMNQHKYLSHIDKKRRRFATRMLKEGYPLCYSGENLALTDTAARANELWLNSPGHRKNLLGKKFSRVGIGKSGRYWVAVYAEKIDSASIDATLGSPADSSSATY